MLPVNRLLQAQDILISKLAKYLHLVNMQGISIQDEDIEKLSLQSETEKTLTEEIISLNKTVHSILGDFEKVSAIADDIKQEYEKKRKECINLLSQIELKNSENREKLSLLMEKQKEKIEDVKKTICPDIKVLNSSAFSDLPELVDLEA